MHLSSFCYLKHATFKLLNIQVAHRSPLCLVVFIPTPLFNSWFVVAYVPLFNHFFQYMILDQSLSIIIIVYCTKLLFCLGKGLSSLTIKIISYVKVFWGFWVHPFESSMGFEYPFGGLVFEPTWLMGVVRESKSCICVCTCTNLFGVHVSWLCS